MKFEKKVKKNLGFVFFFIDWKMEKTLFLSSKELPPNYIFANDKVKMIESLKKAHRDCYKTTNALNECVLGRKKVNFTEILHIATTHFS